MYPVNVDNQTLIKLRTQELKKQLLSDAKIEALLKSGKLHQTIASIDSQVKSFTEEWFNSNKPKIIYQVSVGTQYATDDEIYFDVDFAIQEILSLSQENLDNFYILWEFEDGFLPYPSKIFFDGKVFSKDVKYNDI